MDLSEFLIEKRRLALSRNEYLMNSTFFEFTFHFIFWDFFVWFFFSCVLLLLREKNIQKESVSIRSIVIWIFDWNMLGAALSKSSFPPFFSPLDSYFFSSSQIILEAAVGRAGRGSLFPPPFPIGLKGGKKKRENLHKRKKNERTRSSIMNRDT